MSIGPLTIDEINQLIVYAVRSASDHPTPENIAISKLILKAAEVQSDWLNEFKEGYQVRGELHELEKKAMTMRMERLRSLPLCGICKELVDNDLKE